jgi:hypothetical protein
LSLTKQLAVVAATPETKSPAEAGLLVLPVELSGALASAEGEARESDGEKRERGRFGHWRE